MQVYERIKEVRKSMDKTQKEFAEMLGVGQSTLAMIEVGKRQVSDRHIKTICAVCNVSEKWLLNGTGEMMQQTDETLLAQLADEYHLSADQQVFVKSFLSLTPEQRTVIVDAVCDAAAAIQRAREQRKADSIDAKVEAYRQELEAAEKGQSLSTTGSADTDADKVQKA